MHDKFIWVEGQEFKDRKTGTVYKVVTCWWRKWRGKDSAYYTLQPRVRYTDLEKTKRKETTIKQFLSKEEWQILPMK